MIVKYSKTGLIKDEQEYDLGEDFGRYFNEYYRYCKKIKDAKKREISLYCLDETMEACSYVSYCEMAQLLKHKKVVYDIGSNMNAQRFFFEKNGTKFIGIDENECYSGKNKWTKDMIIKTFPFNIPDKDASAVSHLCLGYLIPFTKENIDYLSQFKTIVFEYSFLTEEDKRNLSKKFYVTQCLQNIDEKGIYLLERKEV